MTFCTAHRLPHPVSRKPDPTPAIAEQRHRSTPQARRLAPGQVFTDWASI